MKFMGGDLEAMPTSRYVVETLSTGTDIFIKT
jgi:hypothetical protein